MNSAPPIWRRPSRWIRDLAREAEVFKEVHDQVEAPVSASSSSQLANRYDSASISSPRRASRDWNRTFDVRPTAVHGGALLIHGLTDGNRNSMRAVAERASTQGYGCGAGAPYARARHRAWRVDAGHRRGLDGGRPYGRAPRARGRSTPTPR